MITRPLDLLSKLRPPPRNFDLLFLVNGGLIALFFALFGSHFVLSPGLLVDNQFKMAVGVGEPVSTPVSVKVNANGQIWGDAGVIPNDRLSAWLTVQAKREPGSALLVIMDTRASTDVFSKISEAATAAGFRVQFAMQSAPSENGSAP